MEYISDFANFTRNQLYREITARGINNPFGSRARKSDLVSMLDTTITARRSELETIARAARVEYHRRFRTELAAKVADRKFRSELQTMIGKIAHKRQEREASRRLLERLGPRMYYDEKLCDQHGVKVIRASHHKKFNVTENKFSFVFDPSRENLSIKNMMKVLKSSIDKISKEAKISIVFEARLADTAGLLGFTTKFQRKSPAFWKEFKNRFEQMTQSYQELIISSFQFGFTVAEPNIGGNRHTGQFLNLSSKLAKVNGKRNSVYTPIINKDYMCAARSLAILEAKIKFPSNLRNIKLLEASQKKAAINLCERAGHPVNEMVSFDDLHKFSKAVGNNIAVVDDREVIFRTGSNPFIEPFYLVFSDNHFQPILSIRAWFDKSYICHACQFKSKGLAEYNNHLAKEHQIGGEKSKIRKITCMTCKKEFKDLKARLSHTCCVPKKKLKPSSEKYIFFDFEAYTDYTNRHIVNLAVSFTFEGEQIIHMNIDEFCEQFISLEYKNYTMIAHNLRGYDSYPIREYLLKNRIRHLPIRNGGKIMGLMIPAIRMRFIDSLSFLAMTLRGFSSAFKIDEIKKGFFPHKFNKPENQNYIGPIPGIEYFDPGMMKTSVRQEFFEFYNSWKMAENDVKIGEAGLWDFQKEFVEYCISDAALLREGCLILRKQFMDTCGCDPFQYMTIASVCMSVYRNNHMPEDSIEIVENSPKVNALKYANTWLDRIEKESPRKHKIIRKYRLGVVSDKKNTTIIVNGYHQDSNTVYVFHSCFFDGCPECFSHKNTYAKKFSDTYQKKELIIESGYNYVEIWEHDYKEECQLGKLPVIEGKYDFNIQPRDALFGGRTNCIKPYYRFKKGEYGKYVDVSSMYPAVMCYDKYPLPGKEILNLSDPRVINIHESLVTETIFGIVKCKVSPPKNLRYPVLGAKRVLYGDKSRTTCARESDGKLVFDLYEKVGTWSTVDLKLAVEKGYKILDVYSVWHYPNQSTGLFEDYIKFFIKIKQETSGYPFDVKTDEQKSEYIAECKAKLNIDLDPLKIDKNPGMRTLAKLCLNSLWGKFNQNDAKHSQSKICLSKAEYNNLMFNPRFEVKNLHHYSVNDDQDDDVIELTYNPISECIPKSETKNVLIGIFTTANARRRLYEMIDKLGDRVLYFDTDSVMYIHRPGQPDPPMGKFLGEWTDELDGKIMVGEFLSSGAKSYAYKTQAFEAEPKFGEEADSEATTRSPKATAVGEASSAAHITMKVKGVSLNYNASIALGFENFKNIVLNDTTVEIDSMMFKRDYNNSTITTNDNFKKTIKLTADKRVQVRHYDDNNILTEIDTIPFGFEADEIKIIKKSNPIVGWDRFIKKKLVK